MPTRTRPVSVWKRSGDTEHRRDANGLCVQCQRRWPCPTKRGNQHVVDHVKFEKGVAYDDAPVTCTCGTTVTVAEYPDHRKSALTDTYNEPA